MLSVSVVIYHLEAPVLRKLLESLYYALVNIGIDALNSEIFLIDNKNQEQAIVELLSDYREKLTNIRLVTGNKNIGYGRGHNIGILQSRARYHLILNPDVILDENSLVEGMQYLEQNLDVSAITPAATDNFGNIQYLAKSYPSVLDLFIRGIFPEGVKESLFRNRMHKYELRDIVEKCVPAEVGIISGCFMLCRSTALKSLGGFDERFFLYFEDFALSMEMKKNGKLVYLPNVLIEHMGGQAARKGITHIFMFLKSGIQFFNLYGWKMY